MMHNNTTFYNFGGFCSITVNFMNILQYCIFTFAVYYGIPKMSTLLFYFLGNLEMVLKIGLFGKTVRVKK